MRPGLFEKLHESLGRVMIERRPVGERVGEHLGRLFNGKRTVEQSLVAFHRCGGIRVRRTQFGAAGFIERHMAAGELECPCALAALELATGQRALGYRAVAVERLESVGVSHLHGHQGPPVGVSSSHRGGGTA